MARTIRKIAATAVTSAGPRTKPANGLHSPSSGSSSAPAVNAQGRAAKRTFDDGDEHFVPVDEEEFAPEPEVVELRVSEDSSEGTDDPVTLTRLA